MIFQRFRRCSRKLRMEYDNKVEKYSKKYGIVILQAMYDKSEGTLNGLKMEDIAEILGKKFPKSPWIDESNIEKQIRCLLRKMGYIFECDCEGNIFFKDISEYEVVVENHLKLTGKNFFSHLSYYCSKTNGRVCYESMRQTLTPYYPKAPYVRTKDIRIQIILFMIAIGLPCRFDDTHMYLP